MMSKRALLGLAVLLSVSAQGRAGVVISTSAAVNLSDGPNADMSNSPSSSVNSSAGSAPNYATAYADTGGNLASTSVNALTILNHGSTGLAQFTSTFTISGNPGNVLLPLSFNFIFQASMSTITVPLDNGSDAVTLVSYDVETSGEKDAGSASLISQAGHTTATSTGTLAGADITITPTNNPVSLYSPTQLTDILLLRINTGTAASYNASAGADASLNLTSVTVPYGFDAVDISALLVTFDSGPAVHVTEAAPIPEPSPLALSSAALLCTASLLSLRGVLKGRAKAV